MANLSKRTVIKISFDTLVDELRAALSDAGFIISGEADFQKDLLEKLNAHHGKHKILTVHNPRLTLQMLSIEYIMPEVLPCSIVVLEHYPGEVEIISFNPTALLAKGAYDVSLRNKAEEASHQLDSVIHSLERKSASIPDLVTSWG